MNEKNLRASLVANIGALDALNRQRRYLIEELGYDLIPADELLDLLKERQTLIVSVDADGWNPIMAVSRHGDQGEMILLTFHGPKAPVLLDTRDRVEVQYQETEPF